MKPTMSFFGPVLTVPFSGLKLSMERPPGDGSHLSQLAQVNQKASGLRELPGLHTSRLLAVLARQWVDWNVLEQSGSVRRAPSWTYNAGVEWG